MTSTSIRPRVHRTIITIALTLVSALTVLATPVAATPDRGQTRDTSTVRIGTYAFPESEILGELYAGVLRAAGLRVSITQVPNRETMVPRLRAGKVQIVPEYLGSLAEYLNLRANGANATPVASNSLPGTLKKARKLGADAGLTLLKPATAQNVNAFAVTSAFAAANGLTTLSDLARWSQTNTLRLGGPPECPERPFCQPGLERVYGMKVAEFVPTDIGGPLTRQAIDTGAVEVGVLFSTDGSVAELGFTVLQDDLRLQNVDNLVPAVLTSAVSPAVAKALNRLSAVLTTQDLVLMNKAVDLDRRSPKAVAAAYLKAKGLT